ncbi:catecholate siderophore receptor Fiu [Massilia sp. 9096]|uniref:catecholate siderophore receptor Fiu n=1 Tax=Massilia sp. 9096 TaxID=1500894 RepID=UPI000563BBE2|nr:catecholate siderophore receptor Fiu [Massilia sp. 9096]
MTTTQNTIRSRKHAALPRSAGAGAALALLMLPFAAHAAEPVAPAGTAAATSQERSDSDDHARRDGDHDREHDRDHRAQRVHVVGERENDFKADHPQSAKYTEKLVDTPQSIIVIKKELFEQQGATTLTEALRNTPGVGTFFLGENGSTNTGDAIYLRGFDTSGSLFVDGIRDIGSISRDIFNIEQIDVLKGPAGTDTGRSAPTGSINLDTKQPQLRSFADASLQAGTQTARGAADLNQVIDRERGIAFRLNALDQDNGNPARDFVRDKRWAVAPSLAFGLRGPTRLYLDFLHVKQDNRPDGGVPTVGLPGYSSPDPKRPFIAAAPMVDPDNFYGELSDYDHVKADMATAILEHEFRDGLRLRSTTRYGKTKQDYLLSSFMSSATTVATPSADPSTWTFTRTLRTVKDQENKVLANQTTLTADFSTGALRHTLVSGLDLVSEKQKNYGYLGAGVLLPSNFYHPDPNAPVGGLNLVRSGARTQGQIDTESAYFLDTIKLGEQWLFGASVRIDHFDTNYDAVTLATATANPTLPAGTPVPSHIELSDNLVSGKVSGLYKPTENSSVYALWATSKNPPGSNLTLSASANSAANPIYQPQVSTTTEIGGKLELMHHKLGLNAALYRTDVKNDVEQDPVTLLYFQSGRKRVQGVELSATGEITKAWSVNAGYAYMDTSVEAGKVVTASGENNLSYTPKQSFTSWTTYAFPFGLKVGGGVRYQGRLLRGTDGAVGTPAYADAYTVVDAMASYRVARWLDLQLNLYNLFDTRYVAAINKSGYRYTPGAPRWASVTANFHF